MRRVGVYLSRGRILVHPESRTTSGLWVAVAPCEVLSADCSADELGRTVRAGLLRSQMGIPHPVDWRAVADVVLSVVGEKSWRVFSNRAAHIAVESEGDEVGVCPYRNLGPAGGFEESGACRRVAAGDDVALGQTVAKSLSEAVKEFAPGDQPPPTD